MPHQTAYQEYSNYWIKNGVKTPEEMVEKEKNLEHKPISVQQINDNLTMNSRKPDATGDWNRTPIPTLSSSTQKKRKKNYRKAQEIITTAAAKKQFALREIEKYQKDQNRLIKSTTNDRYPEQILSDLSGTKEAIVKNTLMIETIHVVVDGITPNSIEYKTEKNSAKRCYG